MLRVAGTTSLVEHRRAKSTTVNTDTSRMAKTAMGDIESGEDSHHKDFNERTTTTITVNMNMVNEMTAHLSVLLLMMKTSILPKTRLKASVAEVVVLILIVMVTMALRES